mgnify:FL=1
MNPTADSGNLCIYEAAASNVTGTPCAFNTGAAAVSCGSAGRHGFGLQVDPAVTGAVSVWGTWAVTG